MSDALDHTLLLGGARSGKSARAQHLAEQAQRPGLVATAQALDTEMTARIEAHRAARDQRWQTVEAPLDLVGAVELLLPRVEVIVVDCLTLWLSNLMHAGTPLEDATAALVSALDSWPVPVIFVSNEVGLGLVPETPLGRDFRDAQGRLNQRIAAAVDVVEFVAAGLPLRLKG